MARPRAKGAGKPVAVLVTIVALVGGLVVGGITGAVAGAVSSEPDGPAAPPPVPESFPNGDRRHLPGVTLSLIAETWLEKGNSFSCAPDPEGKPSTGAKQVTACEPPDDADVWVDIEHDDETKVRAVTAHCGYKPGANACRTLFASFARTLFDKRPELRKQAGDWATKNVDSDSSTVIGGIWLEIHLNSHRIEAAPWV